MRRALTHRHAPVLATALAAAAYLVWAPATADMAGHTYRAWLFTHEGLTVWNAQWYGGHHVLGYSLAFAPLSVWPGPLWAGALSAVAAVALLAPLAQRGAADRPAAATAATWLFALGVLSNLVIGRMPFVLGIALAVAAWAALERPGRAWGAAAAALALGCVLASPVAGAFLLLAAIARVVARRDALPRAALLGVPVLAGGATLALLFPEGGDDRFVASAFWPMLAISVAGLLLLAPARRAWWAAGLLAVGMLALSFAVPNTFGQNALRLPVLLGPVALLLAPRREGIGGSRLLRGVVVAVLVYLAWLPAVRAVGEAQDDPSTQASFFTAPREFLAKAARPGERVEVAFTHNHWEAAYLASEVPLARGWERQLDEKANPIFYDGRRLTPAIYHRWLRRNAVRWVALPSAPLDYSAQAEARLVRRGLPYLRLADHPPGWRIYEVRDTEPPASDGARMLAAGPDGFEVEASGPTVVRQRFTRYWSATGGCVSRAPDGWTRVDPTQAGPVVVRAHFALGERRSASCGAALSSTR
ncbi:MAG TPA: hypothetical protein VH276_03770 [Solirubrobacteraceae bacterium]|jgi:hypothetical protein|nr:hypothetical protein [Solirubrobacteraceae bacterium]